MVNGIDQLDPAKLAVQRAITQSIADAAADFEAILRASLTNAPVVATPAISPERGVYTLTPQPSPSLLGASKVTALSPAAPQTLTVTLACETDGAIIYYTTDGSTPTTSSAVYSAPVAVSDSTIVKAVAIKSGYTDSGVSDAAFAFVAAPTNGSISVSVSPAAVVNAGAQWQADGGPWQNSGAAINGLAVGSHTVTFKTVSEWTAPTSQTVVVDVGQTTFASGAYIGSGTRKIALAGDLAFGSLPIGSTTAQTLTISNYGSDPLTITGISLPAGFSINWASGVVASGDSRIVAVTFAPTSASIYAGSISVSSDKTSGNPAYTASGVGGVPDVVTNSTKALIQNAGGANYLTFSYQQVVSVSNLTYTVEVSDDLQTGDWTEIQIEQLGEPVPSGDGATEVVTVRLKVPISALPDKKFLRLKVKQQ